MSNEEYTKVEEAIETIDKSLAMSEWDEKQEIKDCLKKIIQKIEEENE